jgi:CheY-like chemotaxis protein
VAARIRLVCWNEDLAQERARALKKARFDVDASPFDPAGMITRLRENPPALMLIDLDRLPSHGRAVAIMLRTSKSMRDIPIVFAGGMEEKIARVRAEVPDALFTDWTSVAVTVKKAMKNPPAVFAQPVPHMQQYAGSRLVKKLDLKAGMKAALIGAEDGFIELLGDLPEGVEFQSRITAQTKLVLWFVRAMKSPPRSSSLVRACRRDAPSGSSIRRRRGGTGSISIRTIFASRASKQAWSTTRSARWTRTGRA